MATQMQRLLESFEQKLNEEAPIFNTGAMYKNPQGAVIQIDEPTKAGEPQYKIAQNEKDLKDGKYEVRKTNSYDSLDSILTTNKYTEVTKQDTLKERCKALQEKCSTKTMKEDVMFSKGPQVYSGIVNDVYGKIQNEGVKKILSALKPDVKVKVKIDEANNKVKVDTDLFTAYDGEIPTLNESAEDNIEFYKNKYKKTFDTWKKSNPQASDEEIVNIIKSKQYNGEPLEESVTEDEITDLVHRLEVAADEDEVQEIIYDISDGVLENEVQLAYDQSIADGDDFENLLGYVIQVLEDNAEYEDLDEARNPANDEVNAMIKDARNNKEALEKLGYTVTDSGNVINPKTGREVNYSNQGFNNAFILNKNRSAYDEERSKLVDRKSAKDFDYKNYLDTDRNNEEKYFYGINKELGKRNKVSKNAGIRYDYDGPEKNINDYKFAARQRDYHQEDYEKAMNKANAIKTNVDKAEARRKEILDRVRARRANK